MTQTVSSLWDYAVNDSTLKNYDTALNSFKTFLLLNNLATNMDKLPAVSEDVLLLYIAHCYKTLQLKYTTIKMYLCGIRFWYLRTGVTCPLIRTDMSSSLRITALLNAVKRLQGQTTRPRYPITATILNQMCAILQTGYLSQYTDSMLKAACLTAFTGFLRCGEFTINRQEFDPSTDLCLGDVTFGDKYFQLHLKSSKTDPYRHGITLVLFKNSSRLNLCPYTALQKYLARRNKLFELKVTPTEPLFLMENGQPLTRSYFILHLKNVLARLGLDTSFYSGHSIRIGAATSGASARLEDHLIRTLGRWSSDCYRTYIRTPRNVLQEAQAALFNELQ